MKFKSLASIIVVAFLFLTGCQMGNNDTARDDRTPIDQTRTTRDGDTTNDRFTQNVENKNRFQTNEGRDTNREHDRYEVSDKAAERIVEEIDEIGQAYVLTSKKNAYVAATLRDNDRTNTNRSDTDMRNRSSNLDDGKSGTSRNRDNDHSVRADDRMKDERPSTGDAANDRNNDRNTGNRTNSGDELTNEVKKQITNIVKDTDRNIDKVYVSTSPDFFNLTNDFADDVQNGHPVEGFFDQIGNMIERVFPQNKR